MPAQRDGNLNRSFIRRRRGLLRAAVILLASALVAALISMFGLARQYGYLKASLLSGPPTGAYYALATRLAERAMSDQAKLTTFIDKGWDFSGQADAAAKSDKKGGALAGAETVIPGVEVFQITKNGLALQATLQGTKYWTDKDLN